jgi:hypothetical protein
MAARDATKMQLRRSHSFMQVYNSQHYSSSTPYPLLAREAAAEHVPPGALVVLCQRIVKLRAQLLLHGAAHALHLSLTQCSLQAAQRTSMYHQVIELGVAMNQKTATAP